MFTHKAIFTFSSGTPAFKNRLFVPRSKSCQNAARGTDMSVGISNRNGLSSSDYNLANRHQELVGQSTSVRDKTPKKSELFSLYNFMERRKMMKPVLERAASVRRGACPRMSESTTLKENELAGGTSELTFSPESLNGKLLETFKEIFPTRDRCLSRQIVFAYLINLRAFISPAEILHKLFQHCMYEQHVSLANFLKDSHCQLFNNVYDFCEGWVHSIPYDFMNPHMRKRLAQLFDLCDPRKDTRTQHLCEELMDTLSNSLDRLERYEKAIENLQPGEQTSPTQSSSVTGLLALCSDSRTVARQLTHIELERLSMIGADEFAYVSKLESPSSKKQLYAGEGSPKNIQYYIDWFNQLSALVATEVLRHSRKKHRIRCIEYFVDIANECINIGNFNSLMAIVAGLSVQPVYRLRKTWSRVENRKLEILQHQLDPSGNFLSYRATLKAAIWRSEGAKNDAERLIVPFFGLQLKDLYLVARKCIQPLPSGDFNIQMFMDFANQIANLNEWKTRVCPFRKVNTVLQYLLMTANFSDRDLFLLSFQCEPPEASSEKEQHRKLLSD